MNRNEFQRLAGITESRETLVEQELTHAILSGKSENPDLDKIAVEIAQSVANMINDKIKDVETHTGGGALPNFVEKYKAQYVLETLIKVLQEHV
jgi:hypothetical protein